ncbi:MAG: AI-2E family transporter [Patescibacteria group bacterium]
MRQTLDISWETIIKVFIAGFVLYILFLARDIVVWFFFALIIALLLDPAVNFLRKLHVPKVVAVILVYLSIFGALGLLIYLTAPIFASEIKQFAQNIPEYFEQINPLLKDLGLNVAKDFEGLTLNLVNQLQESSTSIIKAIALFFGGITSTILIFVFAFYISLEDKGPEKFLALLTPKKYEHIILSLFEKAKLQVSRWFGARILACLFVGIISFIVFFLFGLKYSFILALISGVLTFVPFVGPLITGILAFLLVGVLESWIVAIYVVIALYIIQAIENNIVTPLLMKKIIDLPPILVLISLLIGGTIFGILGMIFVVPVFGIVYEFLKDFLEKRKKTQLES